MNDNRPSRRKCKDNPYTLSEENGRHVVKFRDSHSEMVTLEIEEPLFDLLDTFEREDLRYLNQYDRHEEHSELTESTLERRMCKVEESPDDSVMLKLEYEYLHEAVEHLPETLRKRVILFYFEGFTYEQISVMEGCSNQAVQKSVRQALEKLKSYME